MKTIDSSSINTHFLEESLGHSFITNTISLGIEFVWIDGGKYRGIRLDTFLLEADVIMPCAEGTCRTIISS